MTEQILDLDVLNIFKVRDNYDRYYGLVDKEVLTKEIVILLEGYEAYYKEHDGDINYTTFSPWFIHKKHRDWMPDMVKFYKLILKHAGDLSEASVESTLTRLKQESTWNALEKIKAESFDLEAMKQLLETNKEALENVSASVPFLTYDDAFRPESESKGYQWPLAAMNHYWGEIRKQKLYLVTATTNTGKSSFVASLVAHVIPQLKPDQCILYFNNEAGEIEVFRRVCSALFKRSSKCIEDNIAKVKTTLETRYPPNVIKVVSIRDNKKSIRDMEAACALYNPGIVVIDQLDKLIGAKESTWHRPYDIIYSWARDLSIKYDVPVLGVTQYGVQTNLQGDVINKKMTQHGNFDSKVDKAANTDYMIGLQNVEGMDSTKKVYLIRAKRGAEGVSFNARFDRDTGVFADY